MAQVTSPSDWFVLLILSSQTLLSLRFSLNASSCILASVLHRLPLVAVQCRDRLSNGSKCAIQSSRHPGALWSTSAIWHFHTQLKNWWSGYWTCSVLCQHVSIPLFLTHKSKISFFSTMRGSLSNWHIWQPHCSSKNFTGLLAVAGIFTKLHF